MRIIKKMLIIFIISKFLSMDRLTQMSKVPGTINEDLTIIYVPSSLTPHPATQVAWVRSPVPAKPTIRLEKLSLFCNPASGSTFSSTAIDILTRFKFAVVKAKVFSHFEAGVRVGRAYKRFFTVCHTSFFH
jgi:hypothetical protein